PHAPAQQRAVLVAGGLAGCPHRVLDPGGDERLAAGHRRGRSVAEDEKGRGRMGTAVVAEAVGVVVGVAPGGGGADTAGDRVEHPRAGLAEPEPLEDLAWRVTVGVPVEQDRPVAETAAGTGITTGDVAVDRDRQGAEDLAHPFFPPSSLERPEPSTPSSLKEPRLLG